MALPFLTQLLIGVAALFAAAVLYPKPKQPKPPSVEDLQDPTASTDRAVIVVFGSVLIKGGNFLSLNNKGITHRSVSIGKK